MNKQNTQLWINWNFNSGRQFVTQSPFYGVALKDSIAIGLKFEKVLVLVV